MADEDHSLPPLPIARGLAGRCPRCGKGKLFRGFLTLAPRCECCGLDYSFADAGDGPAVFVILIAGFIVAGGAPLGWIRGEAPSWVDAPPWGPLILITPPPPPRATT